jgi:hypothetical protein
MGHVLGRRSYTISLSSLGRSRKRKVRSLSLCAAMALEGFGLIVLYVVEVEVWWATGRFRVGDDYKVG